MRTQLAAAAAAAGGKVAETRKRPGCDHRAGMWHYRPRASHGEGTALSTSSGQPDAIQPPKPAPHGPLLLVVVSSPHLDAHSGRRLRLCLREASLLFKTVGSGWGGRWGAGDIRWAVRGLSREIQRRSDAPPRFGRQRTAADAAAGCLPFNRLWLHPACSHILTALALSSAEQCRGHPDACACYKAAVASPSGCGDGQGAQRTPKWRGKKSKVSVYR